MDLTAYCTDEWRRWQQGECLAYAVGLQRLDPTLRIGTLYEVDGEFCRELHFFAHDDTFAYDSAGRHPLPYLGVTVIADGMRLDEQASEYDEPDEADVNDAAIHAGAHGILTGRYPLT